jgi:hypothetical protein
VSDGCDDMMSVQPVAVYRCMNSVHTHYEEGYFLYEYSIVKICIWLDEKIKQLSVDVLFTCH